MIDQAHIDAVLAALSDFRWPFGTLMRSYTPTPAEKEAVVRAVLEKDDELRANNERWMEHFGIASADELRVRLQRVEADLRNELGSVSRDFDDALAERDAAREQVARLRAALRELIAAVEYDFTPHMSRGALTVESIEAARAAVEGGEPTG